MPDLSQGVGHHGHDLYGRIYTNRGWAILDAGRSLPSPFLSAVRELKHMGSTTLSIPTNLMRGQSASAIKEFTDDVTSIVQTFLDELQQEPESPPYHLRWTERGILVLCQELRQPLRLFDEPFSPRKRYWQMLLGETPPHIRDAGDSIFVPIQSLENLPKTDVYHRGAVIQLKGNEWTFWITEVTKKSGAPEILDSRTTKIDDMIQIAAQSFSESINELLRVHGSAGGCDPYRLVTYTRSIPDSVDDDGNPTARCLTSCYCPVYNMTDEMAARIANRLADQQATTLGA